MLLSPSAYFAVQHLGDQVDLPVRSEPPGSRVQLVSEDAHIHLLHTKGP